MIECDIRSEVRHIPTIFDPIMERDSTFESKKGFSKGIGPIGRSQAPTQTDNSLMIRNTNDAKFDSFKHFL